MIFNMQLSEDASLAELSDIRVGVDGTVYPSAGDAVRGQITDVKEDISVLSGKYIFSWHKGTYSATGDISSPTPYSNRYSDKISTNGLAHIRIKCLGQRQTCVAYWNKSDGSFVSRTSWSTDYIDIDTSYIFGINVATLSASSYTTDELLENVEIYIAPKLTGFFDVFSKVHTVYQGWSGATQKPQTYYASYGAINIKQGDTVTAKSGFQIAILTSSGGTIQAWTSSYTAGQAWDDVLIIIRITGAAAEMLLSEYGYRLSNYIYEDFDNPTDARCSTYAESGVPLALIKQEISTSSKWNAKKAAFIGDSITAGVGTTQGNIYYQILNNIIGFSSVYADGIAGSCWSVTSNYGSSFTPISQRWSNIPTDSSLIVIFAGTNDFGHNTPLGTLSDTTDVSFYGALYVTLSGILQANPSGRLVLFTPIHRWGATSTDYPNDGEQNGRGLTLKDYVDAIKASAEMFGVPVIDLFGITSMNPRIPIIKTNYVPDGLHPNAAGHTLMAGRIKPFLETM